MNSKLQQKLHQEIADHNVITQSNIVHQHLTFEELVNSVYEIIDDHDYEMQDVLDDYREYCYSNDVIPNDWKRMRVQLAGTPFDINKKPNLILR